MTQDEIHPKGIAKAPRQDYGHAGRGADQPTGAAKYEAGQYTTENTGHFWIGQPPLLSFYFSYPGDIRICRFTVLSKSSSSGAGWDRSGIDHYAAILPEVAKHSSQMERRADEAERRRKS